MQEQFIQQWKAKFSFIQKDGKFLLAVSGGTDSVVMPDLFNNAGLDFCIAHCNFQLRGEESLRDEEFVKQLAIKYQKEIFIKRFDTNQYAEENKMGVQEAARDIRYGWFNELFHKNSFAAIVTAHHADDNIETVLMNLFRGTGLNGMTGIPQFNSNIIRPLLDFKKEQLLQYANQNGLSFVEDSSNSSVKYTRNFFRNELLPAVKKVYPQAEDNVIASIERFKEANVIYNAHVNIVKQKLFELTGNPGEVRIAILQLKKLLPANTWIWELFKDYGAASGQVAEIIKLLDAANAAYIETSAGFRIIKNRKWFIITPASKSSVNNYHTIIEAEDSKVIFPGGMLQLEKSVAEKINIHTSKETAVLDMKNITFPLLLRKFKQGDYFYPLGMQKKKKLSRFFIDQKLSADEKQNAWVIESDKKIIWVVGMRIDDRFKVMPSTKEILKLKWSST